MLIVIIYNNIVIILFMGLNLYLFAETTRRHSRQQNTAGNSTGEPGIRCSQSVIHFYSTNAFQNIRIHHQDICTTKAVIYWLINLVSVIIQNA